MSTSAERMKWHRARRASGLRSVTIEVRDTEVAEMTRRGLLAPQAAADTVAIRDAIHALLDRHLR